MQGVRRYLWGWVLLVILSGAGAALAQDGLVDLADAALAEKLFGSVVRIDMAYTRRGRVVHTEWGHGVFVTPSGVLLTAGHVAFPRLSTFQSVRADGYQLVISKYQLSAESYVPVVVFRGNDLTSRMSGPVLAGQNLVECHEFFSDYGCLRYSLAQQDDFVFIDSGMEVASFVGLGGPEDEITLSRRLSGMSLAVLSDFSRLRRIDAAGVVPTSLTSWPTRFRTETNARFRGGVSGSPLVIYKDDPKAAFTVGIVLSRLADGRILDADAEPLYSEFDALTFSPRIALGVRDSFRFLSPRGGIERGQEWDCRRTFFPSPFSLYTYYLSVGESSVSSEVLADCGRGHQDGLTLQQCWLPVRVPVYEVLWGRCDCWMTESHVAGSQRRKRNSLLTPWQRLSKSSV